MAKRALPTADELVKLMREHGTFVAIASALGIPDQTIHSRVRQLEREGAIDLRDRLAEAREGHGPRKKSTVHHWPARDVLVELVKNAPTVEDAATALGVSRGGLVSHCRREGIDITELRKSNRTILKGDSAELTASELADAEELMRERGFDPADWRCKGATVNEWGLDPESGQPYKQLKIHLEKRPDLEWVFPASLKKPAPRKRLRKPSRKRAQRVCVVSDHQAPYHSEGAQAALLRFLEAETFDRIVHAGDLLDFPTISRHRDSAVYNASAQECIDSGAAILQDIASRARERNPSVVLDLLVGNHDERLRTELLLRAERMFNIQPADIPGFGTREDSLSLNRLLHLDALGWTLHDDPAGYKHVELELSPRFVLRHGWLTGQNPAKKSMEIRGTGIGVGHTHAKRQVWVTKYHEGKARTDVAVELGTLSQTRSGIGFAVLPDWHPGWVTVSVHHDGLVAVDHAVYHEQEGEVLWRDNRY